MYRPVHWRTRTAAAAAALLSLGVLAACSSSTSSSSGAPAASSSAPAATSAAASSASASGSSGTVDASSCGTKPGVAATGTPINLGTIVTNQPGTSFTDISNMAQAYFNCVNDNGGINGHPIKYFIQTEQTNPTQIASEAKQLVQSDHVVGIVGNISILECTIDHKYWEGLGYAIIDAGIAPECWSTPNSAAVNMGPRYSSDGAVQYVISKGVSKIAFDQSNVPGTGYIAAGPVAVAGASKVPIQTFTTNVPIQSADSVALQLVQAAGKNGAVVLNFTPPEALKILQAAAKLHIQNNVKAWGCSTPCDTDFLAKTLGTAYDNKLFVNAEALPADGTNTQMMNLYRAVLAKYGSNVSGGVGSFSEFGFMQARLAVQALESVTGDYTVQSVTAAIKALKDVNTGMACGAFTYGDYPMHIPNNADYTVTPNNGQMLPVPGSGCLQISTADPQIAQYVQLAGRAPTDPTSVAS
jgi:branched-chain amino acid transport system substrate-binding protein